MDRGIAHPHNAFFLALVKDPKRAATLLRDHLPKGVAARLGPEPPVAVDGTFIDKDMRETRSDRLFRVRLKGGKEAYIYALLEHKSHPDPATPLQLLGYMLRIWTEFAGDRADLLRALPPIIAVVFYHGPEPWNVPLSVADMIDSDEFLRSYARDFRYELRNLVDIPLGDLSSDPEMEVALAMMRFAFESLDEERLKQMLKVLKGEMEELTLGYIVRVGIIEPKALRRLVRETKSRELEDIVGPVALDLIGQGKAEGLAEGRAKGRAEERTERLAWLLERRFGPLPEPDRERIARATPAQTERWFDAAIDASSLQAVFKARSRA